MARTVRTAIIAEIGQNHNGDLGLARELIHTAKANGADAVKFQLYDAGRLFPREGNPWFAYNCKTQLSRHQMEELMAISARVGIECFASVFDVERVGWLESLGVQRYKVASRSVRDAPLLAALRETGKPLIVSLGCWDRSAFPEILTTAPVDFLYCVARYPTRIEDVHLHTVDFQRYAGFSDHTIGITAASIALARGARIIEKHFTLDVQLEGPDHAMSMTPNELGALHRVRTEIDQCLCAGNPSCAGAPLTSSVIVESTPA